MKNILVPVDFEGYSTYLLLGQAYELAKKFDSKIWLIHVAAPDPDFVGYEEGPQYIRDKRAEELRKEHKMLKKYTDELHEKGVQAEGLLIFGSTVEMIHAEAKKLKIDLEKVPYSIDYFGNTSSASIPLTICYQLKEQVMNKKLTLLLAGFGVGFSWGSMICEVENVYTNLLNYD